MKQIPLLVVCLITLILPGIDSASGQVANATTQNVSSRVGTARAGAAARPVVNTPLAPRVVPKGATVNPGIVNSSTPRVAAPPAILPQQTYLPAVRSSNPNLTSLNVQPGISRQQSITLDPATRQTELRTLAGMRERRGLVTREGNILDRMRRQNEVRTLEIMHQQRGLAPVQANTLDAELRDTELRTLETMRERRAFGTNNQTLATIDPEQHVTTHGPEVGPQPERRESPKQTHGKKWHNKKAHVGYEEAFRRHWHEFHDRNWWHDHCDTIVFVTTGYYFLDGSYWYPAYGYDPLQSYYDYDGPIYTYSDLLPDEVIANVQTALQEAGYYFGSITGSLGVDTRAAIANFQRDYGLEITGAIDEATVEALGLY
jgi:hypothetical protein